MFREGRTETVRSCTIETCAFVRAMVGDETVSPLLSFMCYWFFLLIVFSLCYCVIKLFVIFHFYSFRISFYREKSVSGCSSRRQKNTKTCTVWQWQDRASIATFSASMWFPNTSERIHPSWRRYELVFTRFVCYRYSNNARNCSYKAINQYNNVS